MGIIIKIVLYIALWIGFTYLFSLADKQRKENITKEVIERLKEEEKWKK